MLLLPSLDLNSLCNEKDVVAATKRHGGRLFFPDNPK
jgi:hypothetical protein